MRTLFVFATAAVAMFALSAPASAYGDAPWCVKANIGLGVVQEHCEFRTFDACSRERGSWGNAAFCIQNSRYLPYWNGKRPAHPGSRKKKHSTRHER